MEKIFFKPHVGKNYDSNNSNDIKILILGESHYCDKKGKICEICGLNSNEDCSDFTTAVLDEYCKYKNAKTKHKPWMRTFTRFTNILLGEQTTNKTNLDFWDSVIFYNYIQSSTNGPRSTPTFQQFIESEDAFNTVLEKYKPDLILVWGKRLWQNLPGNRLCGEENILDNKFGSLYYYSVDDIKIPTFSIFHPSTSYFNYRYTSYLKEVIKIVKLSKGI